MRSISHSASILLSFLFLLSACALVQADDQQRIWQFSSGTEQNLLLELFTSEGCSSCPPADRWMSGLKESPQLWSRIVPVAFHVDYWDDLGWKDTYSSPANTHRQQIYKLQRAINAIYTPGFVANGREWRGWFERSPFPPDDADQIGTLDITVNRTGREAQYTASFTNTGRYSDTLPGELTLNVAVLSMDEKTDVRRGENKGKALHHDFVARTLQQQGPAKATRSREDKTAIARITWKGNLKLDHCEHCAIAAWVSHKNKQAPVQATGGYLE
ncbi:MAG: DUF1223 domain-containing protein [Porticoccaceae bacterium]